MERRKRRRQGACRLSVAALRLLGETSRGYSEPLAFFVQVDEASLSFHSGREACDDEVTEGDAEVVGEGYFVADLEVAGYRGCSLRVGGQVVLGTAYEMRLVLEGCHTGLSKYARPSPGRGMSPAGVDGVKVRWSDAGQAGMLSSSSFCAAAMTFSAIDSPDWYPSSMKRQ